MNVKNILMHAALAVFCGCSVTLPITSDEGAPAPGFISLQLKRTACFGTCPVYSVTIQSDGAVHFNGIEYVAVTGEQRSQVADGGVSRLAAELERVRFFRLKSIERGAWGCLSYKTDHPSTIIRVSTKKEEKKVEFYTGCGDTKNSIEIVRLAKLIDEIADTSKWVEQANGSLSE